MTRDRWDLTGTPGQTVGPFFALGLGYDGDSALVPADQPGAVTLHGRILDGAGDPVPDGVVELWQADAVGQVVQRPGSLHRDSSFTGWGRCATDADGRWAFTTVLPGASFFSLVVFARGLLDRLHTRAYLPDAPDDGLLTSLDPDRRRTLRSTVDERGLAFDIRLQGPDETVFLTYPLLMT